MRKRRTFRDGGAMYQIDRSSPWSKGFGFRKLEKLAAILAAASSHV
jgi:hypothetical protein